MTEAALIPFSYTYASQPRGCCGGYYDDPSNTIMNDGVKPTSITSSNCIEFKSPQHQPTIDLGAEYAVTSLELSYVAAPGWGKWAPKKVVASCRSALSADACASAACTADICSDGMGRRPIGDDCCSCLAADGEGGKGGAAAPVQIETTFSGLSNYGGHTVRIDLKQCGRARYITVEYVSSYTNVGELAVLGCQSSPQYCASN